jgi:hypothetical protein
VSFTVADRCFPTAGVTCNAAAIKAQASSWPDVPADLICAATGPCTTYGPSFFSTKRLASIATTVTPAGGVARPVRSWALAQSMVDPGDGTTSRLLWLDSLIQTGNATTPSVTLPAVRFYGTSMANRVDAQLDGVPAFNRWRVTGIDTGTGAVVSLTYTPPDCAPGDLPAAPESNTRRCFPVFYAPPGASTPAVHYFHKYLISQVVETDNTTSVSASKVTSYTYTGDPAWHYDDNALVPVKYRTYGDWRGYASVRAQTGTGVDGSPIVTVALFMRGMDGDPLPGGGARSVSVTDSQGGVLADHPRLAGFVREQISYVDGVHEVSGQVNTPWLSAPTGSDGTRTAAMVEVGQVDTRTPQTYTLDGPRLTR